MSRRTRGDAKLRAMEGACKAGVRGGMQSCAPCPSHATEHEGACEALRHALPMPGGRVGMQRPAPMSFQRQGGRGPLQSSAKMPGRTRALAKLYAKAREDESACKALRKVLPVQGGPGGMQSSAQCPSMSERTRGHAPLCGNVLPMPGETRALAKLCAMPGRTWSFKLCANVLPMPGRTRGLPICCSNVLPVERSQALR
ncbi:hypothetical protein NDU88_007725 [Pleurodeles waltl]|uniref:Uncharacterized protein n=1 Tax=Pleurodeles waltl TaxID=8319 RepID=A0AAV7N7Q3_PLEWA|nr:hypothetical protein NDU88_007725 [Pleurodeles waltl]